MFAFHDQVPNRRRLPPVAVPFGLELIGLKKLAVLNLSRTTLSDAAVKDVTRWQSLQELHCYDAALNMLQLTAMARSKANSGGRGSCRA